MFESVENHHVPHSITFGEKNSWDDWHLISPIRPFFNPPAQKTTYLDIPGANGSLDISETLTGYPLYDNREGQFQFLVMNGYKDWTDTYADIMEYLHGRRIRAYLEDDPDYFYEGRFEVSEWQSTHPWSSITIGYNVDPFKWSKKLSTEDWLWDPFVFATDWVKKSPFRDIVINSDDWTAYTFKPQDFGVAPVCPYFIVDTESGSGLDVKYKNLSMGLFIEQHLPNGKTRYPGFIFYGYSEYELYFKGHGTLFIEFRAGRL